MIRKTHLIILVCLFFFTVNKCAQFNPGQHATEKFIDTAIGGIGQIAVTQANNELSFRIAQHRPQTPAELAAETLNTKQQKVADMQEELAREQKKLTEAQIQDAQLDSFSKKYQISRAFYENDNSQEAKDMHERYRQKIREMNNDLPELPTKELSKTEADSKETSKKESSENTKNEEQKPKISLSSKLATPFVFAFTKAGECADFFASHSFVHLTSLDCCKGTFIETHQRDINRLLVATTVAILSYSGYKLYKKYSNVDDEDSDDDDFNY